MVTGCRDRPALRLRTSALLLCLAGGFAYREALPGYRYQFPRDHFEHRRLSHRMVVLHG